MWIFRNDAMLSIVEHNDFPEMMLVRARRRGDIQRVFPKAKVIENAGSDYAYRAVVDRLEVASAMFDSIMDINYGNFKNSIPVHDQDRYDAYGNVWRAMLYYQMDEKKKEDFIERHENSKIQEFYSRYGDAWRESLEIL